MSAPVTENWTVTVEGLLDVWAGSLPAFTDVDLQHEAERVEYLPKSPVSDRMRTAVDAELGRRSTPCVDCWAKPGDPHELSCSSVSIDAFNDHLDLRRVAA
jgi:hypothetical protein